MNTHLHRPQTRDPRAVIARKYITTAEICALFAEKHGYTITQQTARKRTRAAGIRSFRIPRVNAKGIPLGARPVLAYYRTAALKLFNLTP